MSRVPVDIVGTGDYQAIERRFGLSRQMLQGCLDLGFPVFVLERSALVYRQLYPPETYGPSRSDWRPLALRLKELCERYGIRNRMPRPIIPGDKRSLVKRVVEALGP